MKMALVGGRGHSGIATTTFYLSEWLRYSDVDFEILESSMASLPKLSKYRVILLVGTLLSILPILTFGRFIRLRRWARLVAYIAHEGKIPADVGSLLNQLDIIVTPSAWNYKLFRSAYRGELKMIPHGIDTTSFRPMNREARLFDLAFLAPPWARHRKGLDIARRVFAQLDTRVLTNSYVWYNSEMKDLRSRLTRFRERSYKGLPKFYNSSKMLLFPSRSEGFGLPALEAMACGTPLVYSDAPAHNEFAVGLSIPVTRTYTGRKDFSPFALIYHDTEPSEYTDAIAQLLADERLREDLGAKARLRSERYDFRITFEAFRGLLA